MLISIFTTKKIGIVTKLPNKILMNLLKKRFDFLTLEKLLYILILTFGLVKVISTGPIFFPDSRGYIGMELFRSFGYPLFIHFHKIIFGNLFANAIIITQFLVTSFAALFFIHCLRKTFDFNKWFSLILFSVIMFSVFLGSMNANLILSEGLAYPLYLFIVGHILVGTIFKKNRSFYFAIILTFFLISVRGQFLFLVPVLLIAILLTYYKSIFHKNTVILIVSVITIPFFAVFTDIAFHKIKHKHAVPTPLTGVQISTIPFFVSDENDSIVFEDKNQRIYFQYVYAKLKEKKLLYSQHIENPKKIEFFFDNYMLICNQTIFGDGMQTLKSSYTSEEKIIMSDKITSSMTFPLMKNNFKKCISIYSSNFIKAYDTSKYLLLFILLFIVSIAALVKKENNLSKFIIILFFLIFGNNAIVAIAEPTFGRYIFYNNWILIAIFLLLFQINFKKKPNE
jgi:hypothetical protein